MIEELVQQYPKKDWSAIWCPEPLCEIQMTTVVIFSSPGEEKEFLDEGRMIFKHHYVPAGNCGCTTGAPGSRWRKQKIQMLAKAFNLSEEGAHKIYDAIEDACYKLGSIGAGAEDTLHGIFRNMPWLDDILGTRNEASIDLLFEIFYVLRKEIGFVDTRMDGSDNLIVVSRTELDSRPVKIFKPVKGTWSNP